MNDNVESNGNSYSTSNPSTMAVLTGKPDRSEPWLFQVMHPLAGVN
jgi:hypothetical protein